MRLKNSRLSKRVMNYSLETADRAIHLKIVVAVALYWTIALATIAIVLPDLSRG